MRAPAEAAGPQDLEHVAEGGVRFQVVRQPDQPQLHDGARQPGGHAARGGQGADNSGTQHQELFGGDRRHGRPDGLRLCAVSHEGKLVFERETR